ncbi:MAG TPA: PqqD family protein [Pyrinomonadaceae bacterium]|jgi:hypothetical protein
MNVTVNPEVIWDEVDGVMTLCHTGRVEYFHLNDTGGVIWQTCTSADSVEGVAAEVSKIYPEEDPTELRREVDQFLRALEDASLLTIER